MARLTTWAVAFEPELVEASYSALKLLSSTPLNTTHVLFLDICCQPEPWTDPTKTFAPIRCFAIPFAEVASRLPAAIKGSDATMTSMEQQQHAYTQEWLERNGA